MFTLSNATSKTQPQRSPHFRTFNGWTSTIVRMRALDLNPARPRKATSWLRRRNIRPHTQSEERTKTTFKQSVPPLSPLVCSSPFMVAPSSSRPAEVVKTEDGFKTNPGFESFCCTKLVLVASTDASRPCRIRRINTRRELPWIPISKPLPPLPSYPHDSDLLPSSCSPHTVTPRNSLDNIIDDGLDVLSLFLRRIAYDVISPSTIHRHLGYLEDGGRVVSSGKHRSIIPPQRYSSMIGVSLAIMEGRLPKALMVMYY